MKIVERVRMKNVVYVLSEMVFDCLEFDVFLVNWVFLGFDLFSVEFGFFWINEYCLVENVF